MYKFTHSPGRGFCPSIFVPTSWILFMPLLFCSFLEIKKSPTTKVKIKYKGLKRAQPFPAASPAEIENSCRISLGNGKDCKEHVIRDEEPCSPLTAGDPGPPQLTSHQRGDGTKGDITLQPSSGQTLAPTQALAGIKPCNR